MDGKRGSIAPILITLKIDVHAHKRFLFVLPNGSLVFGLFTKCKSLVRNLKIEFIK